MTGGAARLTTTERAAMRGCRRNAGGKYGQHIGALNLNADFEF
jgi:hypothetical protein